MGRLTRRVARAALLGLLLLSCGVPDSDGAEVVALDPRPLELKGAACDPGALPSLEACAPMPGGNCHLCAAVPSGPSAVCLQPCVVGEDASCGPGRSCHPMDELLRSGGYGRMGDCPTGYCR